MRYVRVHGHGGELGVDVPAGRRRRRVAGEGLRRGHLVFAAELQRSAAVLLLDLRQVGLGGDHHAGRLAVHEILLRGERRSECGSSGIKKGPLFDQQV